MSFNRVEPHKAEAYVEAVIDGHEDWQSALSVIEDMMDAARDHDLDRILLDFTSVDMRVAVSEAPDIARLFDSFAPWPMQLAIIPPADDQGRAVVESFSSQIGDLGHGVTFVRDAQDRANWVSGQGRMSSAV